MREDGSPMPADGDRATAIATKGVTFRKRTRTRSHIADLRTPQLAPRSQVIDRGAPPPQPRRLAAKDKTRSEMRGVGADSAQLGETPEMRDRTVMRGATIRDDRNGSTRRPHAVVQVRNSMRSGPNLRD